VYRQTGTYMSAPRVYYYEWPRSRRRSRSKAGGWIATSSGYFDMSKGVSFSLWLLSPNDPYTEKKASYTEALPILYITNKFTFIAFEIIQLFRSSIPSSHWNSIRSVHVRTYPLEPPSAHECFSALVRGCTEPCFLAGVYDSGAEVEVRAQA
jgi:hypothetical protein